jgi:hypothetical protein
LKILKLLTAELTVSSSDIVFCKKLHWEGAKVQSSMVREWRKEHLVKSIENYEPNIYNADGTGLLFSLPSNKTIEFERGSLQWWKELEVDDNCSISLEC